MGDSSQTLCAPLPEQQPHINVLLLTSHAHTPPLRPAPALKYDLRAVANPPKAIRDAYTGVSKRLRDHMLDQATFTSLLDQAVAEIQTAMATFPASGGSPGSRVDGTLPRPSTGHPFDEIDANHEEFPEVQCGSEVDDSEEEERNEDAAEEAVLSIAAFCARGHHRSVAFVEELARRKWPPGWEVRVVHRDLTSSRSRLGRSARGGHRKGAGGFDFVHGE